VQADPGFDRQLIPRRPAVHLIQNARINLVGSALNNLGVGAIIARVVVPMVSASIAD
jgi:hypothetical protein